MSVSFQRQHQPEPSLSLSRAEKVKGLVLWLGAGEWQVLNLPGFYPGAGEDSGLLALMESGAGW